MFLFHHPHRLKYVLCTLLFPLILLQACAQSETLFQSQSRKAVLHGEYEVQKGDSLYSIAWRFKRDYKELARLNGIQPPYVIHVGQKINLARDKDEIPSKFGFTGQSVVEQADVPDPTKPRKSSQSASSSQASAPKPSVLSRIKQIPAYIGGNVEWQWPAEGKVIQGFSSGSVGKKGIQIAGRTGDPVRASADGQVVYSGNSLLGYGNLVIVKHNNTYLTAYAHNRRVIVKEGDSVEQGQQIAEMGASGTDRTKLHFEIRKQGKPVNPLAYLPRR